MPIYEGVTIEAAIAKGLKAQKLKKENAVIDVLEEPKKGFLGMGRRNAKVSIEATVAEEISEAVEESVEAVLADEPHVAPVTGSTAKTPAAASETAASEQTALDDDATLDELSLYLAGITKELGAPATVRIERKDSLIILHLDTDKQGILIGKHGKILNALQYLAQVFIHRIAKNKLSVVVNVGDYREKRQEVLTRLAERTAEKVQRTGQPVFLEPMPAFERKWIHSALSKNDRVKTHSEGDEPYRYLIVEPAKRYY